MKCGKMRQGGRGGGGIGGRGVGAGGGGGRAPSNGMRTTLKNPGNEEDMACK